MPTEAFLLAPSGAIPNHPRFPVLLHRGAIPGGGAAAIEAIFAANGWPPAWRNGVFGFDHFHSEGHEALGCAAGSARLLLGGPGGREVTVTAGDVVVLPAGTGHRRLAASGDFLIVGAYPPGQHADILRGPPTPAQAARILALPAPASDPAGASDGVATRWGQAQRDRP
ncbi:cupin [Amaricoccus sp.]|uniref:cupin n=1 Tax=Amaricoccus sp. TaxID=1872485 RepID=UPI001B7C8684|nr:cupin [Amaricoccus sp.]MBP7240684.1 cupin [Amaricoccus sp.]